MRGHIKSRSPGSWSIVLSLGQGGPDGRPRQRWVTIHGTKKDAQKELTRLLGSQDTGAYIEPSKLTTVEYLQRWLRDYAAKACSPKTCERWEGMIRLNIAPTIGHIPLSKLTAFDVDGLYTELAKRLAPRTVRHVHRMLFQALRQAGPGRWNLMARNPAGDVVAPRVPKQVGMAVLDGAQMAALIEQSKGDRLHVPIVLASTCGLRRGEVLGLQWSDVNFEKGTIQIIRSVEETKSGLRVKPPKNGKARVIPMMGLTADALRRHRVEQAKAKLASGGAFNPDDRVCPGLDGKTWIPSRFTMQFHQLMKRAQPKVTFHALRHSHATLGLSAGVPAKVMSERLGHSSVALTLDVYSHVLPTIQASAVEVMEAALVSGK